MEIAINVGKLHSVRFIVNYEMHIITVHTNSHTYNTEENRKREPEIFYSNADINSILIVIRNS